MLLYSAKRHLKLNLGIFFEQIIFWTGKHATRQSAVMTSSKKFGTELRQKSVFVSLSRSLIGCVSLISIFGFKFRFFSFQNVFIFPGIPELLRRAFDNIGRHIFDHSAMKKITHEHFLSETELIFVSLTSFVLSYGDP